MNYSAMIQNRRSVRAFREKEVPSEAIGQLRFTWIYRKAFTNLSREPENRVQKALYEASLAGKPILLAGAENSANGISWLILVIGSK